MDNNAIEAEISAQSVLVNGLAINKAMVEKIDRHIKDKESHLNENLAHLPAKMMLKDFLPSIPINHLVTKVDEELWRSLSFVKSWRSKELYEEISYEKGTKGFAFFYRTGEVVYDLGFHRGPTGMECYYKIIEDKRETFRVTGASVEIKLRAFKHLRPLLSVIANQADHLAAAFREEQGDVNGNEDLSRKKVNLSEIAHMGQMDAIRHLRGF